MLDKLTTIVSGLSTPRAPRKGPIPLPALENAPDSVPPLSPSSALSNSSGSPSPITPSPRNSPTARRAASKLSRDGCATPKDIYDVSRFPSPDPALVKARARRPSTPATPEIVKPTPLRPWVRTESTTVMQVAVPPVHDVPKPLKGILKPPRPATTGPPNDSTFPSPSQRSVGRPASSASRRPSDTAVLALHWQLLPPPTMAGQTLGGHQTKQVLFDVRKPLRCIRIRDLKDRPPRVSSWDSIKGDLAKEACSEALYKMTIRCENIPGLEIRVTGKNGNTIRCEDVFEAIFLFFDKILTPDDRAQYITKENSQRCYDAFLKRCEEGYRAVPPAEQAKGMRFVDLLEANTYFRGLRRPIQASRHLDKYWVLNLGPCPPGP
ncbi:hypothetical protein BD414DRAFT_421787 [Trametes punicea]|nr:hypothetical protein BD414DRAFT_421787 [Trametes punicea]